MRALVIALVLVVAVVVGYLVGVFSDSFALITVAFCSSWMVLPAVGWAARGAFGHYRIVPKDVVAAPVQRPRREQPSALARAERLQLDEDAAPAAAAGRRH